MDFDLEESVTFDTVVDKIAELHKEVKKHKWLQELLAEAKKVPHGILKENERSIATAEENLKKRVSAPKKDEKKEEKKEDVKADEKDDKEKQKPKKSDSIISPRVVGLVRAITKKKDDKEEKKEKEDKKEKEEPKDKKKDEKKEKDEGKDKKKEEARKKHEKKDEKVEEKKEDKKEVKGTIKVVEEKPPADIYAIWNSRDIQLGGGKDDSSDDIPKKPFVKSPSTLTSKASSPPVSPKVVSEPPKLVEEPKAAVAEEAKETAAEIAAKAELLKQYEDQKKKQSESTNRREELKAKLERSQTKKDDSTASPRVKSVAIKTTNSNSHNEDIGSKYNLPEARLDPDAKSERIKQEAADLQALTAQLSPRLGISKSGGEALLPPSSPRAQARQPVNLKDLPKYGEFEAFCDLSGDADFFCWKDLSEFDGTLVGARAILQKYLFPAISISVRDEDIIRRIVAKIKGGDVSTAFSELEGELHKKMVEVYNEHMG